MICRLLNLLTVASLLLCVAAVVLWVRSFWYDDQVSFSAGERMYGMQAVRGRIALTWTSPDRGWRNYNGGGWSHVPTAGRDPSQEELDEMCRSRFLGFATDAFTFNPGNAAGPQTNHVLVVPHWFVVAASLAPLALPALSWARARRRRARGLCAACGYDLRATRQKCPECGRTTDGDSTMPA